MIENTYFYYWILFLLFWVFILKLFKFKFLEITIPGIVFLVIVITNYLAYPILFYDLDYVRLSQLLNKEIIYEVWFISSIHITLIVFGIITGIVFHGKLELKSYHNYFFCNFKKNQKFFLILLSIFCILIYLYYYLQVGFDQIAILNYSKSKVELFDLRSGMGSNFEGDFLYTFFGKSLLSFTFIALLLNYLNYKESKNHIILFTIGVFLFFFLTSSTEKYQFIKFFLQVFLVYAIVRQNGQMKIFPLLLFLLIVTLILTFTYYFFMDKSSLLESLLSGLSRVFLGNIIAGIYYYEYFPNVESFLHGKTFPNPGGILPFGGFSLSRHLYFYFNSHLVERNITGSIPAVFWAEMYANFGTIISYIISYLVGYFLYFFNKILFQFTPNAVTLSLFIWLIIHYQELSISYLSKYLIDVTLVFLLIFVYFLSNILPKLSTKNQNNESK